MNTGLISPAGDYKRLLSYQKANVVFLITCYFCEKFLRRGDRTIDQMVQAARSGKQNIIEGCAACPTSIKTGIKLLNVAKASLKELVEDYEDFLKVHCHRQWEKGSAEFETMRNLGATHNDYEFFQPIVESRPPETVANMAIILINQADYLLFKQIGRLEEKFLAEGGFSEKMTAMRKKQRGY